MRLDIEESFGSLYPDPDALKNDLYELQKITSGRDKFQKWAWNLRFIASAQPAILFDPSRNQHTQNTQGGNAISGSKVEDRDSDESSILDLCSCNGWLAFASSDTILMITPIDALRECTHYVAVSWCWQLPQGFDRTATARSSYIVVSETSETRACKVPSYILSRAIAYADKYDVKFIWVDKECINQDNPEDQEAGIQSMDLVYQRSMYPLGLLQTRIDRQEQMDVLSRLIEGKALSSEQLPILLEVLTILSQDLWFTRAWILQESVAGGMAMTLLMAHNPSIQKPIFFGKIPGEIEITITGLFDMLGFAHATVESHRGQVDAPLVSDILQRVTTILAFLPGHYALVEEPEDILQYADYRQTCNAAQALTYLKSRRNDRIADRIAILGNLCDYRLRLDTNAADKLGYGFSICAFALALFNGDLSLTRSGQTSSESSAIGFSWGPQQATKLEKLDWFEENEFPLRTGVTRFTLGGLLVKGWLWKIHKVLTDQDVDARIPSLPTSALNWELMGISLIHTLIKYRCIDLARIVFEWFRLDSRLVKPSRKPYDYREPQPGSTKILLQDVFDLQTGELIFRSDGYVEAEQDLRTAFLTYHRSVYPFQDPLSTIDFRVSRFDWLPKLLFLDRIIPLASLVNEQKHVPAQASKSPLSLSEDVFTSHDVRAIFDVPTEESPRDDGAIPRHEIFVFQPSTIIDHKLAESRVDCVLRNWVVTLQPDDDPATGCRIIHGTGKLGAGVWKIPDDAEPETFLFR